MKNNYTSSIIKKYGDSENVPRDVQTIFEIYNRQGASIFIDYLAEKVGSTAAKFKLSERERENIITSLVSELREALSERL